MLCLGLCAAAPSPGARAKSPEPEPTAAPAPNPQPPPATETEAATTGKVGPRPLMGLSPRAGASPDLPKPPRDPAERRAWLGVQLEALFKTPALARARVSAIVVEADSGKTLYAHDDKTPLNAASNVKIVTSAASLSLLGPEYRWRTTLSVNGPPGGPPLPAGGEVSGDLYLRGSGDPTLSTEDLAAMVSDLASLGLHKVHGALVVDDSLFDGGYVPPAYDQKNDSTASRAPSSAASLDGNVVAVTIIPGAAAGAPARIVVDPASPYFTVAGRVVTAANGPAAPASTPRRRGRRRASTSRGGSSWGPTRARFTGGSRSRRCSWGRRCASCSSGVGSPSATCASGPRRAQGLRVIATHDSAPLAVVVQDLNKRSNNFAAEQLLRTLGAEIGGHPGNWDKGLKAVARYLAGIGIKADSYQMKNGSGLYDSNRFSAAQIATILRAAAHDFRISAEFLASLAVAGTDGTIAHRMGATLAERYVRAKTGTLANVSCLSGFAGSPGHLPLVFSILVNDVGNPNDARHAQDRAAEILVAYLEGDALAK